MQQCPQRAASDWPCSPSFRLVWQTGSGSRAVCLVINPRDSARRLGALTDKPKSEGMWPWGAERNTEGEHAGQDFSCSGRLERAGEQSPGRSALILLTQQMLEQALALLRGQALESKSLDLHVLLRY